MTAMRKIWALLPSIWLSLFVGQGDATAAIHTEPTSNMSHNSIPSGPDLTGTWHMNCVPSPTGGPYGSQSQAMNITFPTQQENIFQVLFYADSDCKHQIVTLSVRRPFHLRPDALPRDGAYPIDFGPGTMELKVIDQSVRVDDPCTGQPHCKFLEDFNLVGVSGNQLMLGLQTDAKDGSSPEKRPTQIDKTRYLTRGNARSL